MPENANSPKQPNAEGKSPRQPQLLRPGPRFNALWPILKWNLATASGREPLVIVLDGREIKNKTALVEYVAAQQWPPVSSNTVWRWLRRLREGGVGALADRPRSDKGSSRVFRAHPDAAIFVLAMFLEGSSPAAICREVRKLWTQLSHDASRPPSLPTVCAYLKSLHLPEAEVRS
jgi:hypothetical protein